MRLVCAIDEMRLCNDPVTWTGIINILENERFFFFFLVRF
jgi:hypothetical protein